MRRDQETARLIRSKMEYSAHRRLRDRMWQNILATHRDLQPGTVLAARRVPIWETAMRSPTMYIAAAVLLAGIFLLARHLIATKETQPVHPPSAPIARQNAEPIQPAAPELPAKGELETARLLFARQDLAGLVRLLATGQDATKVQVAEYLGQIGDSSVLPALQTLAAQWQGPAQDNPFLNAVAAIEQRRARLQAATAASAQEPNQPPALKPSPSPQTVQTGVSGRVVDKLTKKPIQGATVQYRLTDPNTGTRTDESGRFLLTGLQASDHRFVYIMAKSYVSQRINPQVAKDRITSNLLVELDRGSRVQGVVTDPNGKPIAGATAKTFFFTNVPVVTGPDGRFEIDGVNPVANSHSLHITHPDYPAVSMNFAPGAVGETVYLNIVLKPGADVFGQVTDPNGKPIEGVQVGNTTSAAMWNCITATTDPEGRYWLDNVDIGELVLWASHSQYALHVDRTTIEAGTTEKRMDIRLQAPEPLQGKIVDDANEPVAGVTVAVQEYNGVSNLSREWYTTDANGVFVIANAPAEGTIRLTSFGGGAARGDGEFALGSQPECILKVHRAGRIYGKVVADATDEPVQDFLVKMTFSDTPAIRAGYSATWNREGYSFKSPEGFFDTAGEELPVGGNYKVTVLARGFDPVTLDPVPVQPIGEDPNRTVFRLKPATLLAGVVVDGQGNPVKDAAVAIFSKAERFEPLHWRQFTTDAAGIFIVTGIGADQDSMYIAAPGFAPYYAPRSELNTADGAPARIVLSVGGRIFGDIVDEQGRPGTAVKIRVSRIPDVGEPSSLPSMNKEAEPDADGRYELSNLPPGRFGISVESGPDRTYRTLTLLPGESLQVDFGNEAGFVLTGIVREGPTPVEGATVNVSQPQADSKTTGTDSAGRFRLSGVPAGEVELRISCPQTGETGRPTTRLMENRTIRMERNTELDIDLGAGSISGPIPEPFKGRTALHITVFRQIEEPLTRPQPERQWANTMRTTRIDNSNGRFECRRLPAGRYYAVLQDSQRTLGITDVFTLSESEHKQDVQLRLGHGQLDVHVIDARTAQGVGEAQFLVTNDLGWAFTDSRLMPTGRSAGMVADAQGSALCEELPSGRYQACAWARGYLSSSSAYVTIRGNETEQATVALSPAAVVAFELSESLRKRIDTDSVEVLCRVTDLATEALVPWVLGAYRSDEHCITMSLQGPRTDPMSLLHLPQGRYRIDYELRPLDTVRRVARLPVHKGAVTADLTTGQTKSILLDNR
jgi:protocatechuate 3,4-dioxygenase beta subunit